jgi:hypothetical protein
MLDLTIWIFVALSVIACMIGIYAGLNLAIAAYKTKHWLTRERMEQIAKSAQSGNYEEDAPPADRGPTRTRIDSEWLDQIGKSSANIPEIGDDR